MISAYRIPGLSWRLPLGASRPPYSIVAHSYSLFEYLVDTRNGREAIAVDIHRGVVWREGVTGGVYIGRGLRIEGRSIVDTNGEPLVKLKLEPRIVRYARRLVVVGDEKKLRIIDKAVLEELGELDGRKSIITGDEYTLAVYGRAKRGYLLAVDSINGFMIERLKRSVRRIEASHGCFVACDNSGCIAGNGAITTSMSVGGRPIAAIKGGCLVSLAAEKGSIIALVESDGGLEVIDSCDNEPQVVYADGILTAYACGGSIRVVKTGSLIPEHIGDAETVITPSFRAKIEESGGIHLLRIEYDEDENVLVPIEHHMVIHRDSIMVLSGGWLYSLDLGNPTVIEVEALEEDGCPVHLQIRAEGYKILEAFVEHDALEPVSSVNEPGGYSICMKPRKLHNVYNAALEAKLAPPLIIDATVSIPAPRPRIEA